MSSILSVQAACFSACYAHSEPKSVSQTYNILKFEQHHQQKKHILFIPERPTEHLIVEKQHMTAVAFTDTEILQLCREG